jgi:hypothetical protein
LEGYGAGPAPAKPAGYRRDTAHDARGNTVIAPYQPGEAPVSSWVECAERFERNCLVWLL